MQHYGRNLVASTLTHMKIRYSKIESTMMIILLIKIVVDKKSMHLINR